MLELLYKGIAVETDCEDVLAYEIIDELIKHRFFVTVIKQSKDPQSFIPNFFHIGYKGHKLSIRINQDINRKWRCLIFSIKAFSKQQPPLFTID